MKGNMDKKKVQLLMGLFVLIVILGAYRIGTGFMDKKEKLDQQNSELQLKVDELNNKIQYEALYNKEIENATYAVPEILNLYAAGNDPVKSIMFIVGMSNVTLTDVSAISFGTENLYFSSANVPIVTFGEKPEDTTYTFASAEGYTSELSFPFKTDYKGLKDMIDYINHYSERMTISSITVSYDQETGELTGAVVVNLYSISGVDKREPIPATGVTDFGTSNIFGTGN